MATRIVALTYGKVLLDFVVLTEIAYHLHAEGVFEFEGALDEQTQAFALAVFHNLQGTLVVQRQIGAECHQLEIDLLARRVNYHLHELKSQHTTFKTHTIRRLDSDDDVDIETW